MGKDVSSQWLVALLRSGNGTSEKSGRDAALDWDPYFNFSLCIWVWGSLLSGDNF